MVKLRLKRMGKIDGPFYRIVALDSRKKRDGKYIESLGYYDPKTDPLTLKVDIEKALKWLGVGAQPSDTVRSLLRKAGVLEKWHQIKSEEQAGFKDQDAESKKAQAENDKPQQEEKEEINQEEAEKNGEK